MKQLRAGPLWGGKRASAAGDTGSTAAGGDAAASGSGEVGKTDITVAMGADIVTLDPAGQQDTTTAVVIKHAYSTLLDISDEGELVPDLAESYELVNDTDFVFKLRDAVWSDGPMTANDKFTRPVKYAGTRLGKR
ncbi:MAG: hypothetical protein ACLU8D_04255 [Enterocloster sp.]